MAVTGNLRDMDLTTLISVNCNEGNQAEMRIWRDDEEALVYFDEGQIVHMVLGDKEGEEVIHDILRWEDASFELNRDVPPPTRTIHVPWSNLVLEGMRLIDEATAEDDTAKVKGMIQDILGEMKEEIPGFMGAVVVDNDGVATGAVSDDPNYHPEIAATQLARLMELVTQVSEKVSLGEMENALITGASGYLLAENLGDGSLHIGVSLNQDATPGLARVIMRDYADRIWEDLSNQD